MDALTGQILFQSQAAENPRDQRQHGDVGGQKQQDSQHVVDLRVVLAQGCG